jgi:tetratricopeptide (TPR) repeat protein
MTDKGQNSATQWSFGQARKPASGSDAQGFDQARLAHRDGNLHRAQELYRLLLNSEPNHLQANYWLGRLLIERAQFREAKDFLNNVLEMKPDDVEAKMQLGQAELMLGEFDSAADHYRAVIALEPENEGAYCNLAKTLAFLGQYEEAINQYLRALELMPTFDSAWASLGELYLHLGRMDDAVSCLKKALDLNPKITSAYLLLADSGHYSIRQSEIETMSRLYEKGVLTNDQRSFLAFALGRIFDGRKEYDKAFEYYTRGNRLRRKGLRFSITDEAKRFQGLRELFTKEFLTQVAPDETPGTTPIFIVGMPRSGTSLVEQILSSHPDVYGAGELAILENLCRESSLLPGQEYQSSISEPEPEDFHQLGAKYLAGIDKFGHGAKFIVDKLTLNFKYIGVIRLALPEAKIIHCRRDPMDNCVSIYRSIFGGQLAFSYDQEELGQYYLLYAELMRHWHHVLPGVIHDVTYEDLIANTAVEIRGLLAHCGLAFDPACLRFHETERAVRTMSSSQVRQPIFSDSISAWKRYESHLEPLYAALGNSKRAARF